MQWTSGLNAGFSFANHTWLPLNPNYPWLNVEKQLSTDVHNTHIGVYMDTMRVRNSFPDRSETFFHVMDNVFIAAHRNWKLLLNFDDSEKSVNIASFLSSLGLPVGITEVAARSVNGTINNSVGQLKDLNENVIMGQMEAVLLLDLINS